MPLEFAVAGCLPARKPAGASASIPSFARSGQSVGTTLNYAPIQFSTPQNLLLVYLLFFECELLSGYEFSVSDLAMFRSRLVPKARILI